MDNKTKNSDLINEFMEIFTLFTRWIDASDRDSEVETKGFAIDTKEIDELSNTISEARKELTNWLTNLSLTALAFFLTILIQINLREKIDLLDRFTVLISLLSLSIASIIGLIDKFLSILMEALESLLKFPETFLNLPVRGSQQFGISEPAEEEKKALVRKIRNFRIKFSRFFPIFGLLIGKTRFLYPFYQLTLFLIGISSVTVCVAIFIFDLNEKFLGQVLKLLPVLIVIFLTYPWLEIAVALIFKLMQKNIKSK